MCQTELRVYPGVFRSWCPKNIGFHCTTPLTLAAAANKLLITHFSTPSAVGLSYCAALAGSSYFVHELQAASRNKSLYREQSAGSRFHADNRGQHRPGVNARRRGLSYKHNM